MGEFQINRVFENNIKIAVNDGDVLAIQHLLENGTDVNDKDADGKTPLYFAVNNGNITVVNILLKNGADPTYVTNQGDTPLYVAVCKGYIEVVKVLLQHINRDKLKKVINAQTTSGGETLLHIAANNGFLEIISCLLQNGAAYDIKNKEYKTPLDLFKVQNVTNLLLLIEKLFTCFKIDISTTFSELKALTHDELLTVINVVNKEGHTLLQVAMINGNWNPINNLLRTISEEIETRSIPMYRMDQLIILKCYAEVHINCSLIYRNFITGQYIFDENNNPCKTFKEGSYYLRNAYKLVQIYKEMYPGAIKDKNIKMVNFVLEQLEFDPKYITLENTKEKPCGGVTECLVFKGQNTMYYKLLHNHPKYVKIFLLMVQWHINDYVKKFLKSIEAEIKFIESC